MVSKYSKEYEKWGGQTLDTSSLTKSSDGSKKIKLPTIRPERKPPKSAQELESIKTRSRVISLEVKILKTINKIRKSNYQRHITCLTPQVEADYAKYPKIQELINSRNLLTKE